MLSARYVLDSQSEGLPPLLVLSLFFPSLFPLLDAHGSSVRAVCISIALAVARRRL